MAVRLRLAMHGTRHSRTFRLIAIDQRKRRNAKPIETLGVYNPAVTAESPYKTMQWSVDRIKYWLGVGAQPTDSVVKLLTVGKVIPPDSRWHSKPTLQMMPQAPPPQKSLPPPQKQS